MRLWIDDVRPAPDSFGRYSEQKEKAMLMKIAHYNDGKEKWQSHTCYLFNDVNGYPEFDITNIYGYGETKEKAIENLKEELEYYFNELHALEKMLYETDILDNEIVSLSFGDFIQELASPHYERYKVKSIEYWDVNEENGDIESFDCLWNFYGYSVDDFVRLFSSPDSYEGVDFQ